MAQQVFIPYRNGNLWGVADTTGKVVLAPKYDKVEWDNAYNYQLKDIFFLAEKSKLKGVVRNNKEIIPPLYHVAHGSRNFYFCERGTSTDRNISLYNRAGKLLNAKPYKQSEIYYHDYDNSRLPVMLAEQADKLYCLFYVDTTGALVNLLKDQLSISKFGDMLQVKRDDKSQEEFYKITRTGKGPLRLSKQAPPKIEDNGEQLMDTKIEAVPDMAPAGIETTTYLFMKQDGVWKSYANYKEVNIDFNMAQYDTAYVPTNFYEGMRRYGAAGETIEYRQILITRKNGFYGAVMPDGRLIPNLYESVRPFDLNRRNYFLKQNFGDLFLVKKGSKYGIVNTEHKTILPIIYDTINADLVVQQENKSGAVQTDGSWILPAVYDEVTYNPYMSGYQMKKGGKYGSLINSNDPKLGYFRLDCISPYAITGYKMLPLNMAGTRNYIVYEVADNNQSPGYFDRKGFAYFK